MNEQIVVYLYNEYYSAIEKKKAAHTTNNMDKSQAYRTE